MKHILLPAVAAFFLVIGGHAVPASAAPLDDAALKANFVGKTFYGTTTSGKCTYSRYDAPDGNYVLALDCGGDKRNIKGTYKITGGKLCSNFMSRGSMQRRCSEIEPYGDGFKSPTSVIHKVVDGNPEGL